MSELAPVPASAMTTQVTDGYQLCARCGRVLVEGDTAVTVRRLSHWLIYSHQAGPNCPPKAVRGWKAARRADTIRNLNNEENIFREANANCLDHLGVPARTCVCILDDKHIESELRLAMYQPSDEAPARGSDFRTVLSRFNFRLQGGGKRAVVREYQRNKWQTVVSSLVETDLVSAIDANTLSETLEAIRDVLWSCRRRSYARFRPVSTPDGYGDAIVNFAAVRELRVQRRRTRLPKALFDVLSRDAQRRPAEWALYSNRKVFKIRGKWVSEFDVWTPKPEPVELPFNSRTDRDLYTWENTPYGPVATLKPEMIEGLFGAAKPAFSRRKQGVEEENLTSEPADRAETEPAPTLSIPHRILLKMSGQT
jgi:hypothetical protein